MADTMDELFTVAAEVVRIWIEDSEAVPKARASPRFATTPKSRTRYARIGGLSSRSRCCSTRDVRRAPTISIDAGLLEAIDAAAKQRSLTRSAFLASAARDKIAKGA